MTDHKLIVKKRMEEQFKIYERLKKLQKNVRENNRGNVTARLGMLEKLHKQFLENNTTIMKIGKEKNIDISNEEYIKGDLAFHCDLLYAEVRDATQPENLSNPLEDNLRLKEATSEPAVKLPHISVKKFSGKTLDWIKFREEFHQSVISKSDLTDSQKFEHLKSALPKDIPLNSEIDFNQTWKILDEKFKNRILNEYFDKIIQHPTFVSSSEGAFKLLDKTIKYINQLESLNINVHKWDELFIHILITKFSDRIKTEWFGSPSCNESPRLYDFLKFLLLKYPMIGLTNEIEKFKNFASSSRSRSYYSCVCCQAKHPLWECEEFKRMGIDAKLDFINKTKVCRFCLNSNHVFGECWNKYACKYCGQNDHHHLLHRHESSRK